MRTFIRLTLVILCLSSAVVYCHPGRHDSQGGHYDRQSGEYHCHQEPCFSNQQQVQAATIDAETNGRAFSAVYRREDWKHWSDLDHNCMNTRHEILKAQAKTPVTLSDNRCGVSAGTWDDPYSGKIYHLASDLDIDHIIPLRWANDHGGYVWSSQQKEVYANDPDNLLAVDDRLNQQKGAKGPDEWMPPNHQYRCEYIVQWTKILNKYSDLIMTSKEKRTFSRQQEACGISP
ncbi:HNH endonuclease [Hahella sp. CCB-MM4]|uniref:HNH endonuclease n=1 Tax=Hahella sp. (strain CCB-MM4) TaxID=1926491 RepID=UPI000B9C03E2|nr:HNH endonuclease [Hahella sp. CCB-MM4]OZG70358.1 HNH endonuclease [Hahella sp. CCB-MM4]